MNRRFIISFLALVGVGCHDLGTGGTGEMVVPQETLRKIQAVDATQFATTAPTTTPSTQPTTRATTGPVRDVPLTLEEVRQLALQNNLDIKVQLFSPTISQETLNEEEARYEAIFTTTANYSNTDAPTASELEGSQVQNLSVTPGLNIPMRTGGNLQFGVPMSWLQTNNQFATLNPSYTSDAAMSISQPLLRGAGLFVNAQQIRVAFYAYQQAQARTKLEVIRVLADADRVYWRLYAARQELLVRKQEYDLAVAQLDRARRQVTAGVAAETEIIRAQSGVADRVESIIVADNVVRDRERELKRILNAPDLGMQSPTTIIPASEPKPLYYIVDPDRAVTKAMGNRMELLELELQIAQDTSTVRVARNDMLPLVSVQYAYNINGLGGDLGDSFTMVRDNNFSDQQAGLQLEIPIGNEVARSRLRKAMLNRLQSLATREQRELQIKGEVLASIDRLEANWQRILAARQRVVAQARVLNVEIRQFEQGLRTSTEVLQAQTQLANAKLSEISAVTDYEIAQVDIAYATGTVLGASHILWQPATQPKP